MKKIILLTLLLFTFSSVVYSAEENVLLESQVELQQEKTLKDKINDIYKLEVEKTDAINPMLKDITTFHPEKGPFDNLHLWGAIQMRGDMFIPDNSDSDFTYDVGLINILLDGEFKGKKEGFRIMLDPTPQSNRPFFQPFLQDAYIETKRIPHHKILFGNSRPAVGVEGAQSPYNLPFVNRSQISRNFGTVRKFGLRVHGDYDLIDYDLGALSSDTFWQEFFPGVEFDGWVNLKPLGKTNGKYGKLVTGGGITAGRRGTDFFVAGAYAGYEYKRFGANFEWAHADGYNGAAGLSTKKASGFYSTLTYKITPKLQALVRYDQFDPNTNIDHNNKREYTAGINYFIKGQALRIILNYIFCQNDKGPNSHRIMLGTQILL